MADVSAIRTAIKTRLTNAAISGLRVYPRWPDSVNLPCVIVHVPSWSYRQAMGNVNAATVELIVIVAEWGQGMDRAQDALDTYLDDAGASSLKAALEADKTLGGSVSTLHVPGWRDYMEPVEVNGQKYVSVTLDVEVWC